MKLIRYVLYISVVIVFASNLTLASEPLTLEEVIKAGLENNISIKQARIDENKARADLELAYKALFPELDLSISYTRLGEGPMTYIPVQGGITIQEGPKDNYSTSLSLQQPVYLGGRISLGIEQAKKGIAAIELELEQTKADTLLQIIQAYYGILMAADRVSIEEDALELMQEHRRQAKASYQAGVVLKTDLLQAQIEESKARQSLQNARNQLKLAYRNLENIINTDIGEREVSIPQLEPVVELKLDQLYQLALENRIDLKLLDVNQEILETSLEMEKRSNYPSIMISGNYRWQDSEFSFADGDWSLTLSGQFPLYDGGKSSARQSKIASDLGRLEEARESLHDLVRLELEQELINTREILDNIELQKMNLMRAEESLEIASKRYKVGVGTNLDVLNAQTVLKQTRIALMQAEYQYKQHLFTILHRTGRLVPYFEEVINHEK